MRSYVALKSFKALSNKDKERAIRAQEEAGTKFHQENGVEQMSVSQLTQDTNNLRLTMQIVNSC